MTMIPPLVKKNKKNFKGLKFKVAGQDDDEGEFPEEFVNPIGAMLTAHPSHALEERGIILINSVISKHSMERAQAKLLALHYNDDWNDEVQVILNSPGGYTDAGWAFIDVMEFVRMPIRTIALGEIASMATMIFVAGDTRVMAPNSTAMIHHFSTGHMGNYPELLAARKADDLEYKKFIEHFIRCSKYKNEQQITKHLLLDQDNWLTPSEMKSHGLCDSITKRRDKKKKA